MEPYHRQINDRDEHYEELFRRAEIIKKQEKALKKIIEIAKEALKNVDL